MALGTGLRPNTAPVEFPFAVSLFEDLLVGVLVYCLPAIDKGPLGSNIGCIAIDGDAFDLDAFHVKFVALQDRNPLGPRFFQLLGGEEGVFVVVLGVDPGIFSQARQINALVLVVSLFACFEEFVNRFVIRGLVFLDQGNPLRGGASEKNQAEKDCARCGDEFSHDRTFFEEFDDSFQGR
ncbi:MAG: hypothetical protein V5A14_00125 [Desulfohalobiaceae bacterium]